MNWYKKAQNIIDQREMTTDDQVFYTQIGHDAYLNHYDVSNDLPNEPNYMWGLINGSIDIEPESGKIRGHGYVDKWSGTDWDKIYKGRYSSDTKTISIAPPRGGVGQFRSIPDVLKSMLRQKFPDIQKMVVF